MATVTFFNATQTNPDRDGMDVVFTYKVDGSDEIKRIHIVGSDNHWNSNQEEKHDYAQFLFSAALFVMQKSWTANKEFPNQEEEYHQGRYFPVEALKQIPWEGYKLELPE